ncbi:xaa-pro aminopeptidase [hydrocarbon metagenome]|uniref:Xaa-pro aminopeptidase n=1 Tax=hydrocarbon metagenome TaxID=938273 RepID=A0A0W8FZ32_9ZZZZ
MFSANTYVERRSILKSKIKSGILLIPGNEEAPMNYPANSYTYRQDSTFLYYFGLDRDGLFAVIDIDNDEDIIFGYDYTIDDIVWMGPQTKIAESAQKVGVSETYPLEKLDEFIKEAISSGRVIHYLPQYRFQNMIRLEKMLDIKSYEINNHRSGEFTIAVIEQRSVKSKEELNEINFALDISYEMNTTAMKLAQPGKKEREIYGALNGIANSMGRGVSFPVICSVHGETLHNHHYDNILSDGDLLLIDSGAESLLHYASDITRTFPVNGKFTNKQKEIYNIVLSSQLKAIESVKPGIRFREVHLKAAEVIANGLKNLGLMKGDPKEAVSKGAHALFFPHGLGHAMGLDVHDLEALGENLVGYDKNTKRSDQFGLAYLRFAKDLQPGYVLTIEPGIYFIPELIDMWKAENKFTDFINYDKVEEYKDFGGIRIEDDIVVTDSGCEVLGNKLLPKTIEEVEKICTE